MPKCPASQLARKRIAKVLVGTPRCAVPTVEIQICCFCVILCPLSFRVQTNHSRLIQGAFQAPQCCDRVCARGWPEQEHCLILWKEMELVLEDHQVALFNLCIRRVGVLNVNRSVREGAVTKRMINADDILLRQSVPLAQWPPAILSLQKFVGKSELKLGISL